MIVRGLAGIISFVFFASIAISKPSDNEIITRLQGAVDQIDSKSIQPLVAELHELAKSVQGRAYEDQKHLYLLLSLKKENLIRSMNDVGIRIEFLGNHRLDYAIRLKPKKSALSALPNVGPAAGFELLMPKNLRDSFQMVDSPGDFKPEIIFQKGDGRIHLGIPGMSAWYLDSLRCLVVKFPLVGPLYPDGVFPVDRKGRVKLRIELGQRRDLYPGFRNNARIGGRRVSDRNQRGFARSGYNGESLFDGPRHSHAKFDIPLLFENWKRNAASNPSKDKFYNFNDFLEMIQKWSAGHKMSRMMRGGQRQNQGSAPEVPPVSVQALFLGQPIVDGMINYYSSFLSLSRKKKVAAIGDFKKKWQTETHTPVLISMQTAFHESYIDLNRWVFFLEDKNRNQYEAVKIIDVSEHKQPTKDLALKNHRQLQKRPFVSNTNSFVILFPAKDRDGNVFLGKKNRKFKLIVLAEKEEEKRIELDWHVPR